MKPRAFSLVELLVVIGIVAILISILMPALNRAQQQARMIQCASNLRQCGMALLMYAQDNQGWIVPVGPWIPDGETAPDGNSGPQYDSLGTNVGPWQTWPAVVFGMTQQIPGDSNPTDYAPNIMRCPADYGSIENLDDWQHSWGGHSYVINKHLAKDIADVKKYGSKMGFGLNVSSVPLLGEKYNYLPDYYLEKSEFDTLVDKYKHGINNEKYLTNYLFMDLHVDSVPPKQAEGALDPWDIPSTTQPSD